MAFNSVWTHNLKKIQFHENFQPESCLSKNHTHMAATLGAGVQDGELFKAMAEHHAIAVGGTNFVCFKPYFPKKI